MTKFMDTLKKLTPTGFSYPIENTEIFIEATEKEKDVLLFISMLKHNIKTEKKLVPKIVMLVLVMGKRIILSR